MAVQMSATTPRNWGLRIFFSEFVVGGPFQRAEIANES